MSIKSITPWGTFKTRGEALAHIERYRSIEFIMMFGHAYAHLYPYNPKTMDYHGDGTNNATRHFIYWVIKNHLHGKVPGWM